MKNKAAQELGKLGGRANADKQGKKGMAAIGKLGGLKGKGVKKPRLAKKVCWYCQEKPVGKVGDLFCSKCVKLKKKDVNRAEQENFFDRV